MHCLACSIHGRVCCYSNTQRCYNHCFSKVPQSSQTQHVLGDQPGSCRYVCWRISGGYDFFMVGVDCNFWKYTLPINGIWDYIIYSLEFLFSLASVLNIAAISLERMHATFLPFKHRVIRKMVYVLIIIAIWVTAAMVSIALVIIKNFKGHTKHYFYVYVSFNSICLFVIFVSYASIFMKISCGAHPQHHGAASRERKLNATLFIVTLVSLLMWLSYVISIFLRYSTEIFSSFCTVTNARFFFSLFFLFYANSLVNPILYAIRMTDFKRALTSIFRFQERQGGAIVQRPF